MKPVTPLTKENISLGANVFFAQWALKAKVTKITERGGFEYTCERYFMGSRIGTSDGGEVYENGYIGWFLLNE